MKLRSGPFSFSTCALIALGLIVVQASSLRFMGHPSICTCGYIAWWYGNPAGSETSQHLTDWYTFTHITHGFGFYFLLWLIAPRVPLGLRLALAIGLEAAWEIVENTPFIIDRYRQSALARGYFGDSVLNSVSDTLAAVFGFALARVAPWWISVATVIAIEVFLGYAIRDNLALNIIQLVYPNDFISRWQMGG